MKTYRIVWFNGHEELVVGNSPAHALAEAGHNPDVTSSALNQISEVMFIAVVEKSKTGTSFTKEIGSGSGDMVNLVGKIDAVRTGNRIHIASPSGVGIDLDVDGIAKTFINGDQIERAYKAFALENDAQEWILAQQKQPARMAG